jgi:hypothetical protein
MAIREMVSGWWRTLSYLDPTRFVGTTNAGTIPAHKPIFRPPQESNPTVRPAPRNLRFPAGLDTQPKPQEMAV